MSTEQINDLIEKKAALDKKSKLRNNLNANLEYGSNALIKISYASIELRCDDTTAVAMLKAGIEQLNKEMQELEDYLNNLEVVPKAKTKKGGE